MTKLRNTAVLLLAALLVIAGAVLPLAVARVQDKATAGQITHADMESLELTLKNGSGLDVLGKLSLLRSSYEAVVVSEETVRNTTEVYQAVCTGMQVYEEQGMLPRPVEDYTFACDPLLVYSTEDPRRYNIFWSVSLSLDYAGEYMNLVVDDETGKILLIDLGSKEVILAEEDLNAYLNMLSTLYFETLELDPQPAEEFMDSKDRQTAQSVYRFGSVEHGEVCVRIDVYRNGFYIWVED